MKIPKKKNAWGEKSNRLNNNHQPPYNTAVYSHRGESNTVPAGILVDCRSNGDCWRTDLDPCLINTRATRLFIHAHDIILLLRLVLISRVITPQPLIRALDL